MPIIKLFCDNGANIHSCRKGTIDTDKEWNLKPGEWEAMEEEERMEMVMDWANEYLEIWYEG